VKIFRENGLILGKLILLNMVENAIIVALLVVALTTA